MSSSSVQYQASGPVNFSAPSDTACLKGKTAIITGGSNGIGAAYVRALAEVGATVVIGDIDGAGAAGLIDKFPGLVHFCKCDVTQWEDQAALFELGHRTSATGHIDLVVANAGTSGQDPVFLNPTIGKAPEKPDLKILRVNLEAALYTTKLALHYFQAQAASDSEQSTRDSCLVLQGSIAGYVDQPGSPQYNASKFGLRGVMRCLRETSLQHHTRVNYIAPWYIETDLISDDVAERITGKGIRFADISDAAEALLRVASDSSIHGRSIAIVPRTWAARGYLDIDHDDYAADDPLSAWQHLVLKSSHRLTLREYPYSERSTIEL